MPLTEPFDGGVALRFPLSFPPRRLAADLARVPVRAWKAHGRSSDHALSVAELPASCAYLRSVVAALPAPLRRARLFKVAAGGCLLTHQDAELPPDELRVHIPLKTNAEVHMVVARRRVLMPAGSVVAPNVSLPHEVYNLGRADRVHMIVDLAPGPEFWARFPAVERVRSEDAPDARVKSLIARRLKAFESAPATGTRAERLRRQVLAAILLTRLELEKS